MYMIKIINKYMSALMLKLEIVKSVRSLLYFRLWKI